MAVRTELGIELTGHRPKAVDEVAGHEFGPLFPASCGGCRGESGSKACAFAVSNVAAYEPWLLLRPGRGLRALPVSGEKPQADRLAPRAVVPERIHRATASPFS